jgi:hypothetical protein
MGQFTAKEAADHTADAFSNAGWVVSERGNGADGRSYYLTVSGDVDGVKSTHKIRISDHPVGQNREERERIGDSPHHYFYNDDIKSTSDVFESVIASVRHSIEFHNPENVAARQQEEEQQRAANRDSNAASMAAAATKRANQAKEILSEEQLQQLIQQLKSGTYKSSDWHILGDVRRKIKLSDFS